MKERFNSDVFSHTEAGEYYKNRMIQLLPYGWSWDGYMTDILGGVEVTLNHVDKGDFSSAIIFKNETGKGYMQLYFKSNAKNPDFRYVTGPMCKKMKSWLDYTGISYTEFDPFFGPEYLSVQKFYGDTKGHRSGQYYMNHIDEGLFIIRELCKNHPHVDLVLEAERAFCLHPLMQDDAHFVACKPASRWSNRALMLTVEYRNIANSYLPKDTYTKTAPKEIVSEEVKIMLVADKIQNCKDYNLYVRESESATKVAQLDDYFEQWFDVLSVDRKLYEAITDTIQVRTGRKK